MNLGLLDVDIFRCSDCLNKVRTSGFIINSLTFAFGVLVLSLIKGKLGYALASAILTYDKLLELDF